MINYDRESSNVFHHVIMCIIKFNICSEYEIVPKQQHNINYHVIRVILTDCNDDTLVFEYV